MKMLSQSYRKYRAGELFLFCCLLCSLPSFGQITITNVTPVGDTAAAATSLNSRGQVVGFFAPPGSRAQHAFLSSGGVLYDLGTLGGSFSLASGINSAGQIVGSALTTNDEAFHAFLIRDGTKFDLGTLGGTESSSLAINESGQVTGESQPQGDPGQHAFLYRGAGLVDLGTLGGSSSWVAALNNLGQVAGQSPLAGDAAWHAFVSSGNVLYDLGSLGGATSEAWGLNDSGWVVGDSDTATIGVTHAFVFAHGLMHDLGTLGGTYSSAFAVNNNGQVMGDSTTTDEQYHGFLYQNGAMLDLGTLGGNFTSTSALNSHGDVVGVSEDANHGSLPFLWKNGVMTNLNMMLPPASGWVLYSASMINDAGQIVGYGAFQGAPAWYLLTLAVNHPPVANAGHDQTVECPSSVTLDGGQSSDPDNDPLTFAWREGATVLGNAPVLSGQLPLGSHVITLTVTDSGNLSSQATVTVNVVDTVAPVVSCPAAVTLVAAQNCQAAVPDLLGGLTATDSCTPASQLSKTQNPPAGTSVGTGTYSITVMVADASGNVSSCTTSLTVADSTPPVVVCPAPVTLPANGQCQAVVPDFLAGLSASDNCTPVGSLTKQQTPAAGTPVGLGMHTVLLTVRDAGGNTTACQVQIKVVDATAPIILSAVATPGVISPPNHKMVPVTVSVSATDNCDPAPVSSIISITGGDATALDWQITGPLTANLRADLSAHDAERVYTLTVRCTDASGNSSTKEVVVVVRKPGKH